MSDLMTLKRFCIGVKGREQCDDCGGRYVADEGFPVPLRILAHQPWPFEPCPHYVQPLAKVPMGHDHG